MGVEGLPTVDLPMVADPRMVVDPTVAADHPMAAITAVITAVITDHANGWLLKQAIHKTRSGGTNLFRRFALVATAECFLHEPAPPRSHNRAG